MASNDEENYTQKIARLRSHVAENHPELLPLLLSADPADRGEFCIKMHQAGEAKRRQTIEAAVSQARTPNRTSREQRNRRRRRKRTKGKHSKDDAPVDARGARMALNPTVWKAIRAWAAAELGKRS